MVFTEVKYEESRRRIMMNDRERSGGEILEGSARVVIRGQGDTHPRKSDCF